MTSTDPFDDVFHLEDRYYQEGYRAGLEDGVRAGRVEGRSFGMEKGFDKFLESGRLASRAIVWANRLSKPLAGDEANVTSPNQCTLPALPNNARLEKNINILYALVEPDTLSTANTDEAVQDFDDRVRRAQSKAKIIERLAGSGRETSREASLQI